MKFKKYKLVCYNKAAGTRIIVRELPHSEYGVVRASVLERNIYLVQKHCKFFGIGYWKTLLKSLPCNPYMYLYTMDYYDLITWGRQQGIEE